MKENRTQEEKITELIDVYEDRFNDELKRQAPIYENEDDSVSQNFETFLGIPSTGASLGFCVLNWWQLALISYFLLFPNINWGAGHWWQG